MRVEGGNLSRVVCGHSVWCRSQIGGSITNLSAAIASPALNLATFKPAHPRARRLQRFEGLSQGFDRGVAGYCRIIAILRAGIIPPAFYHRIDDRTGVGLATGNVTGARGNKDRAFTAKGGAVPNLSVRIVSPAIKSRVFSDGTSVAEARADLCYLKGQVDSYRQSLY